ncbi:MAG: MBOAT family protein [Porphyromonadaceae bacterium]|nr:MAG: MBOAT family protein [Porphyromonadaceae bacterium]
MVFSSIIFLLFFLPVFLAAYYVVPRKARNYVVLLFSIVFFAWGAPDFLPFLLGSCLVNFYLVQFLDRTQQKRIKRLVVGLSIAINLGLLFYFKYANFFLENVSFLRELFGSPALSWERIILPIGISFFTFQSITYSVDVYRSAHQPLKNPFDYILYIIMFPQLLAGPIIRFEFIANQIRQREDTWKNILYGFYRFILGLSKKVLIADVLALEVDRILGLNLPGLDTASAWIAILAYTFQLYFDFSGYSDMAIGLGKMIGFKFPENFNNPYISGSVTEFWRRWHITFSNFMRHYLYYPLGGNRVNTQRRLYFNLWLVFLVSGLWHGASWNFVLYGAFHGFFMVLERLFLSKIYARIGKFIPIAFTFLVIVLSRVFFRIEALPDAMGFMKVLFSFRMHPGMMPVNPHFYAILIVAVIFSFITLSRFGLRLQTFFYDREYSHNEHTAMTWLYAILLILSIASLTGQGFSPFIYFRF